MPADSIDAHHHLRKYSAEDRPWMPDEMEAIQRDFPTADLKQALRERGIGGAVTLEARQTLAETDWLLDLDSANDVFRGLVGWAPLTISSLSHELERLAVHKKLNTVRRALQDEPDWADVACQKNRLYAI